MIQRLFTIRKVSAYCSIAISCLLVFGAYLQFYSGIVPCPLCLVQRWIYLILTFLLFIGALYLPTRLPRRIFYGLCLLLSLLGAAIAGYQVWLQRNPSTDSSCSASLDYVLHNYPLMGAISELFSGKADCGVVSWSFMNFSIAEFSAIIFAGLSLIMFTQIVRKTL